MGESRAEKMRAFGKRLGERMDEMNVSAKDIVDKLGCDRSAVSKWRRGERGIHDENKEALAEILQVPLSFFYEEDPESEEISSIEEKMEELERLQEEVAALDPGKVVSHLARSAAVAERRYGRQELDFLISNTKWFLSELEAAREGKIKQGELYNAPAGEEITEDDEL